MSDGKISRDVWYHHQLHIKYGSILDISSVILYRVITRK